MVSSRRSFWKRYAPVLVGICSCCLTPSLSGSACSSLLPVNPVSLTQDASSFTLSNGYVSARVARRSGDLISLKYHGTETLGAGSGHPYAYWSHTPDRSARIVPSIRWS